MMEEDLARHILSEKKISIQNPEKALIDFNYIRSKIGVKLSNNQREEEKKEIEAELATIETAFKSIFPDLYKSLIEHTVKGTKDDTEERKNKVLNELTNYKNMLQEKQKLQEKQTKLKNQFNLYLKVIAIIGVTVMMTLWSSHHYKDNPAQYISGLLCGLLFLYGTILTIRSLILWVRIKLIKSPEPKDIISQIGILGQLKVEGKISQEEFDSAKQQLLGTISNA